MQLIEGEIGKWKYKYVESPPETKFLVNYLLSKLFTGCDIGDNTRTK